MINFLFALLLIPVHAQDLESLFQDLPFQSKLDAEMLQSQSIKQSRANIQTIKPVDSQSFGAQTSIQSLTLNENIDKKYDQVIFGASFKTKTNSGKVFGQLVQFGSSSDKIFQRGRDNFINATSFYKPDEKWIYLLSYSNNRSFMNNIPLPGFIYLKDVDRKKMTMLGFPLINIFRQTSNELFGFRYLGIVPFNHRARIYFYGLKHVFLFTHYEQWVQNYFDSDRDQRQERLFYSYKNASFGIEKNLGPFFKLDVQVGNGFDRRSFFSKRFSRQRRQITKFSDEIFSSLNLRLMF